LVLLQKKKTSAPPPPPPPPPSHPFIQVADNLIDSVGTEFQGSSGIHLFAAVNATVEHNRILNNPCVGPIHLLLPKGYELDLRT
jgi:hypothetical protein